MTFDEIFYMVGRTVKVNPRSISKMDGIILRCATDIYIKQMEIEAFSTKLHSNQKNSEEVAE